MTHSSPMALFMIQEYDWMPALEELLGELGIHVDRVDSIQELSARWTEDPPLWIVVEADLARVLADHWSPLARRRRSSPSILIVSQGLLEDLGEVEEKLAAFSSSVRTVSPVEIPGELTRSLGPNRPGTGPAKLNPATILCVDDDPRCLKALARRLVRHGYQVHASSSGPQAIEAAARVRPDLAIVDVRMPDMGGLELTERFSRISSKMLPVVLLTGSDSEETAVEGFRRGALYLLHKSDDPGKVLEVVDYFVGDLDEPERQVLRERLEPWTFTEQGGIHEHSD
ncbi:MAG TPA: response regulator [Planctomycetota bacterium]|nr:response regulator [Planctomycetota bacterium]